MPTNYKPFTLKHLQPTLFDTLAAGQLDVGLPDVISIQKGFADAETARKLSSLSNIPIGAGTAVPSASSAALITLQVSGISPSEWLPEGDATTPRRGFTVSFTPEQESSYADCYASFNIGVDAESVKMFPIGKKITVVLPGPLDNTTAGKLAGVR